MDYKRLTAPCGIDCFNCQLFKENAQSPERLELNKRVPQLANVLCKGCRDQNCPLLHAPCPTRQCAQEHTVDFCHECSLFPCNKLMPMADEAARYPHNIKVYNLCRIKAIGIEEWARNEAQIIRDRYFKGRFQIGAGPQII